MSVKFEDFDTEKYILACCLQGPQMWKDFPEIWLRNEISKKTMREFRKILQPPYNTYPSVSILMEKCEDVDVKLFVTELSKIKVDRRDQGVKLYDLWEMYAAKKVYDVAESIPNDLEKSRIEEVVRAKITELSKLMNPFESGQRKRGFIYEGAKAKWNRYREIEKNPAVLKRTPLLVSELDKYLHGGVKPGWMLLFYAESGGLKTKTLANLAYNLSHLQNEETAVVTLEVPFDDYEDIIVSRDALLDFNNIQQGELGEKRDQYKKTLIKMAESKPPLYLIDIPGDATSMDLIAETELFYSIHGFYPKWLFLDYANEMDPVTPWKSTGEKFKNLGVEFRRIVRTYKYGFFTAVQENREGKKLKDKTKVGTEHIGESHSFQNPFHVIIHQYQDSEGVDNAINQLHMSIKKNRYGEKHVTFSVFANPAYNYIGDRKLTSKGELES